VTVDGIEGSLYSEETSLQINVLSKKVGLRTCIQGTVVFLLERCTPTLSSNCWCGQGQILWQLHTREVPTVSGWRQWWQRWTCPNG